MSKKIKEYVDGFTQDPVTRKIERVAAYIRVSTQEQKLHGLSLDAQKEKLKEYAEKGECIGKYFEEFVCKSEETKGNKEKIKRLKDQLKKIGRAFDPAILMPFVGFTCKYYNYSYLLVYSQLILYPSSRCKFAYVMCRI